MSMAAELGEPILAGEQPPAPGWRRWLRGGEPEAFAGVPRAAYASPIVRQRTLLGPMLWLNDPDAIRHVLVDQAANYPRTELERQFLVSMLGEGLLGIEGDTWRAHRRIMAPSFDPRSVASYAPTMAGAAAAFAARWEDLAPGAAVDMAEEMTALTLRIIARTMFSAESDRFAALVDETVRRARDALGGNLLDLLPLIGAVRRRSRERTMRGIFAGLDAALEQLIAEREAARAEAPIDLLSRLIAAKDDETGGRMTAVQVRDQVVTIFLAGHETTAVTMTWIWYLLALHPAQAARLHAELDQVLAGRTPGADDIARLPYARMVVDEALRLYPAAPGISARQAQATDWIGETLAPAGTIVQIMPWLTHRNPRLWPHPERFDPERFSPERSAGRPRHAYLPFGAGPRICIGAALALTECVLILATLAQRFAPVMASDAPVELEQRVTLRPKGGLPMRLERRRPGG